MTITEFFELEAGDLFRSNLQEYRKQDTRRAQLICCATGETPTEPMFHSFYPEEIVERFDADDSFDLS